MPSTLEKSIVPGVNATKKAKAKADEAERKERARREALKPSKEDWLKLCYPSIIDGKYTIDGDSIRFVVAGEHFQIKDDYVPAYEGSADDGHAYAHDSYWTPTLFLTTPNEYAIDFGSVGGLDEGSYLNSIDSKRSAKERKSSKEFCDDQIKKINDKIAERVKGHLLKKDNWDYKRELERIRQRR